MLTKVIVILLICLKLDYTTSLPDIIRIGEEFSLAHPTTKICSVKKKSFFMQHRVVRRSIENTLSKIQTLDSIPLDRTAKESEFLFDSRGMLI